jgi:hypothetical protein
MIAGGGREQLIDQWLVTVIGPTDLDDLAVARIVDVATRRLRIAGTDLADALRSQTGRALDVRVDR